MLMSCYTEHKEWESRVEDDGVSYNYEQNQFNLINLSVEKGKGKVKRIGNYKTEHYRIKDWIFIK